MADIETTQEPIQDSIEAEKIVTEVPLKKEKKPRSEAQKAAFEKCRVARVDQIKRIKESGGTQPAKVKRDDVYKLQKNILEKQEEFMNTVVEKVKEPKKKPVRKRAPPPEPIEDSVTETETETESEPEPPKPKPKRKYTKKVKQPESETETETETDQTETESEPEPPPSAKRAYTKRQPQPVASIRPVLKQPSVDFR